ncbi:MAG: Mut7-C RNAse domain-containing protein, partial [Longimicrobiales bacterium]|nr:Mut7-C RNAse domain-containing protein [Longimicrobiales bacterium]
MAIRCPGCGREYDITLFQFGRTIHCTCGKRVGREQRIGMKPSDVVGASGSPASGTSTNRFRTADDGSPRFIADAMLGRVARWLRTLGYDTAYDDAISDSDLVRRSLLEGRIILTRDSKLPREWRIDNYLLLEADTTRERLTEIVSALDLERPEHLFTRCRACNVELEPVDPEDVTDEVPSRVLERTR